MRYMLDTNICIFLIKNRPEKVIKKFLAMEPEDICISSITYAELVYGVEKSQEREKNRIALMLLLSEIGILSYDDLAAQTYGVIRADLERKGTPIGPMDLLIAAHAKSKGLTIVTSNVREFTRVEGLAVEDGVNE